MFLLNSIRNVGAYSTKTLRCASASKLLSERVLSTTSGARASLVAEQLFDRASVRVVGQEAQPFLQGLITNDINRLAYKTEEGETTSARSIYTVFLNVQGRIMLDSIIFRESADSFLIDCDVTLASLLVKHLKMYKVRRKIEIAVADNFKTWSVFRSDQSTSELLREKNLSGIFAPDPRFSGLGFRVLTGDSSSSDLVKLFENNCADPGTFKCMRHNQAVAEGSDEIPLGKCFPLEYNIDYLNGIDFHKGCYIGQELTARTHHTGVVRKRILPITGQIFETGQTIVNEKEKNVGQVRGVSPHSNVAIGLMRVEECSVAKCLTVKETGLPVQLKFPDWWPKK